MIDISGEWYGTYEGTHSGNIRLEIAQNGTRVYGEAGMDEPGLGKYRYAVEGKAGTVARFTLTPHAGQNISGLVKINVEVGLRSDGQLKGQWGSNNGRRGRFLLTRRNPLESDAAPAEQKTLKVTDEVKETRGALSPVAVSLLPDSPSESREHPKAVFIAHGHDDSAIDKVARFVEKLGLEAVVLREQLSATQTIIEKFERHAHNAGFAVVIFTPDDEGFQYGKPDQVRPRGRQNVVLELGYFAGRLGRGKTFVLKKGNIEFPSDMLGILYHDIEDKDWMIELANELVRAGYSIDFNRVFKRSG